MAMASTLTSSCNASLPQTNETMAFESKGNNLGDASFSSYLDRRKEEDGEIGVFGAEKYFNGRIDDESPRTANVTARKYQYKKEEQLYQQPIKPEAQPAGTPSVRSESSWNSQSALLLSIVRNPSQRKTNKVSGRSFLAGLGCNCYCSDKNSVDVDEHVGEISFKKRPNHVSKDPTKPDLEQPLSEEMNNCKNLDKLGLGLNRENCLTVPSKHSQSGHLPVTLRLQPDEDLKPWKSLKVFGSPVLEKRKNLNLERRLTMLSWDVTPRAEGEINNDSESDASSDLFEIESLTGKVNSFLARQASDATSGCVTPTAGYAPSEASIEWSVVTASAADFSVMSDSEELIRPPTTTMKSPVKMVNPAKTKTGKEIQRRGPGILLGGCNSQKAVRIAGNAYGNSNEKASYDPTIRRNSNSIMPVIRFQAETKLTGFDTRRKAHSFATARPLPRSLSPRNSHPLLLQ